MFLVTSAFARVADTAIGIWTGSLLLATWGQDPCATPRAAGPISTLSIDFGIGCAARNIDGRFGVRRFAACGDVDRQLWAVLAPDTMGGLRPFAAPAQVLPQPKQGSRSITKTPLCKVRRAQRVAMSKM